MDPQVFTTIALTGFTVAFFHAAIPTHWLPFVLTARVQKWSKIKTLIITAAAGCGHTLITALLGFLIAWCGIVLNEKVGEYFPLIAGGALLAFGCYHIILQFQGDHGHSHFFCGHSHEHPHDQGCEHHVIEPPTPKSDWGAIASLLALLTFSPCESFLPVYVSGVRYGWTGFLLLTAILSVATVAGMILFTSLMLAGMKKIELQFLEDYERGILGVLLCALGVMVILFEV